MLGTLLAYLYVRGCYTLPERAKYVLIHKWGLMPFIKAYVIKPILSLSKVFHKVGDVLFIDRWLVHGIANLIATYRVITYLANRISISLY